MVLCRHQNSDPSFELPVPTVLIYEILPVDLSVSSLSAGEVLASLAGFVILYAVLFAVEMWLMIRTAKTGPSTLATGRYFFERRA